MQREDARLKLELLELAFPFVPSRQTAMSLPPPDYSAPLAIRRPSLPVNAHASSSRSSSRTRSRPRPSRTNSARLEDFVHWVPAPPPDETAKLPSSITINYPPEDLIVLLSPPRVDPLGEEDWSHEAGMGGRDVSSSFSSHSRFSPALADAFTPDYGLTGLAHLDCNHHFTQTEASRGSQDHRRRSTATLDFSVRILRL